MMASDDRHVSVLLEEVLLALAPKDGGVYVDGTFGAGGYSRAILKAANCKVYAIDRDPLARQFADRLGEEFKGRFELLAGCFGDMVSLLAAVGVTSVDGIALDIGVSSMQIDDAARGFSFAKDGPLDMRMSSEGKTAADVVNTEEEGELANIIFRLGEERRSRAVARAIVARRLEKPFETTLDLADLVATIVKKVPGKSIHPATKTFQALRIHVNDELGELARGLLAAESLLVPGGRLAVVSFHSLEDRYVKRFLAERSEGRARPSRHLPEGEAGPAPSFRLLKKGSIKAGKHELENNIRSRSARLRAVERTSAPAWGMAA
jgi:16S rRNA (cytosine1402-N4)-methyltransferase